MTAHSSHTPIYTPTDLAGLVAKHDREHPDHAEDCGCHNGLIWTLRIYFAPTISVDSGDSPRPYVPPDVLSPRAPDDGPLPGLLERKPWLQRRCNETKEECDYRISHSCYKCGLFLVDEAALNQHEDQCSQQCRHGPDN